MPWVRLPSAAFAFLLKKDIKEDVMNVVKWFINLIKILNSNQAPGQVAGGIAFAFMLALIPANNLLWIVLFVFTFFLKIHNGIESLFLILFKLITFLFDPLLDSIGYSVLTIPSLYNFFTRLANMPLMPFSRFNNTVVMGGLVLGIALWIPVYVLFLWLIKLYRNKLKPAIENSKLVKGFFKLPLISFIVKLVNKVSSLSSTNAR